MSGPRHLICATTLLASLLGPRLALAATLEVGPGKTYATPCAAIMAASAGDTIQVDASGSYTNDTCNWSTDNLTIVGVNGRPKINLSGVMPTMQKGIFTIYADNATIDNMELSGAAIDGGTGPGDSNGAGIRHLGTNLTVKNCYIHDNQDGILGVPASANTGTVLVENTELYNNGEGDGYTHNLYLGDYATVTVKFSYSHHAIAGHLLKSRAYASYVLYNRLSDESGGTGSYEVDLPNGGTSYVIGNVIEQSAASQNPNIITYGEETVPGGYDTHLYVVNNTVINDLMSGTFVNNTTKTAALVMNNIFYGGGTIDANAADTLTTNYSGNTPMLADVSMLDVHLLKGSPCIDTGTDPGKAGGFSLEPVFEYLQPVGSTPRAVVGKAIDIGAYEYGLSDAGMTSDDASSEGGPTDSGRHPHDGGSTGRDSGSSEADGGAPPAETPTSSSGCGCTSASARSSSTALLSAVSVLFALSRRRRARKPSL